MIEFRLLETMRLTAKGELYLLDRHLARLQNSAAFFSFPYDREKLLGAVDGIAATHKGPLRVRLQLARDGEFELDAGPLPLDNPRRLKLLAMPMDSSNPFLQHKTTNRSMYGADVEVLLMNERRQITETPIANVAVRRHGKWITPPVSCGLLPGVFRAELLARGELIEGVISLDDLVPNETVRCFNALRGVFDVPWIES
jgi:para-aminobenzoate synthetase/4-amino-4-deoxychorismate lyase